MVPADLEVKHVHTRVNGIEYHCVERGSGPLLMLLHGFPENWWAWRYQIAPLAEAGFRVVAPDLRGFNDSGKDGPFDLEAHCADITALIRELGEARAHLVGQGLGGTIAWQLAAMRPAYVDRLAAINAPHPSARSLASRAIGLPFQLPLLPEWLLARDHAALVRRIYQLFARDPSHF